MQLLGVKAPKLGFRPPRNISKTEVDSEKRILTLQAWYYKLDDYKNSKSTEYILVMAGMSNCDICLIVFDTEKGTWDDLCFLKHQH